MTTPVIAAIYVRRSTSVDENDRTNSVALQEKRCREYAAMKEWHVHDEIYSDVNKTGSNLDRPGLTKLKDDIVRGTKGEGPRIGAVLCLKHDRLTRSLGDFVNTMKFFEDHGVAFVATSQSIDTSTPVGRMIANILASFGEYELSQIRERTRDAKRAKIIAGPYPGPAPFGFRKTPEGSLEVDRYEMSSMSLTHRELQRGEGWQWIAEILNENRQLKREGRPWTRQDLRRTFNNCLRLCRTRRELAHVIPAWFPGKVFTQVRTCVGD
jgi:site-specific DNA recombinase